MTWFRKMFRPVPLDTDLWPESQGAGCSPNEMNGTLAQFAADAPPEVLGRMEPARLVAMVDAMSAVKPWREGLVEPSDAPWDWPSF